MCCACAGAWWDPSKIYSRVSLVSQGSPLGPNWEQWRARLPLEG